MSFLNNFVKSKDDQLVDRLAHEFGKANAIDINVAFAFSPGVELLSAHLEDLIAKNACTHNHTPVRILLGDYLDATDPQALRQLLDLGEGVDLRIFETTAGVSFHPKSFIVHYDENKGAAYIGSSNISRKALKYGIEWNYRVDSQVDNSAYLSILREFEELFNSNQVVKVDEAWIKQYEDKRNVKCVITTTNKIVPLEDFESPDDLPLPHLIQVEALNALSESRTRQESAGLVVLATGLGKTWLAAFDSKSYNRILFVAHREEILLQANKTFRKICPEKSMGLYMGAKKQKDVDVLFASVQTLGRQAHLEKFRPEEFDYIIVDEFHHASATTYRRLIDHFSPKYLLGLTATPERMDGGDILALCDENLVFQCDLLRGIEEKLLSPFHYFGVPDEIDYENIPWRNGKFDQEELTNAWAIESRAQNALEQLNLNGGDKTICFCCSIAHADYMNEYFSRNGKRSAVVHSQSHTDPRAQSLEKLERGELDIVCAVDIFNEGVDIPLVDTVLMLRPTESPTIWAQQFGRGLRYVEKKILKVIDYIGNHKSFLNKTKTLLSATTDRELKLALKLCDEGEFELPQGCSVTYELDAMSILEQLVEQKLVVADQVSLFYDNYKDAHQSRPLAIHAFNAGVLPSGKGGYISWIDLLKTKEDLPAEFQQEVTDSGREFIQEVEKTRMTKSFKMVLLKGMIENGIQNPASVDYLRKYFVAEAALNPFLSFELGNRLDSQSDLESCLIDNPINAWLSRLDSADNSFFVFNDNGLRLNIELPKRLVQYFTSYISELVDYRLARYWPLTRNPELWHKYTTDQIKLLYKSINSPGNWMSGYIRLDEHKLLLVTLDKGNRVVENLNYSDKILDKDVLQWESPSGTTNKSKEGVSIIKKDLKPFHLYVRETKTRGSLTQPYVFCGEVELQKHHSQEPIRCEFKLKNSLPADLFSRFKRASEHV